MGCVSGHEGKDSPVEITQLRWNEAARTLNHSGAKAWTQGDAQIVEIVSR